jgi:hypothetical protein
MTQVASVPHAKSKSLIWKLAKILGGLVLVVIGFLALVSAVFIWTEWRAEHRAREFCAAIPVGADIAPFVAKAEKENKWSSSKESWGYSFLFPAGFDAAYCNVRTDANGKVIERKTEMMYD